MARGGKFGWFLGLVFGTLFGMLFAKREGKELRQEIKKERKKGKLGLAPLSEDMKHLGQEIVSIARDFIDWKPVADIVKRGRARMKDLSDDFVEDVADFHVTRIAPIEKRVKRGLGRIKRKVMKKKDIRN